MEYRHKREWCSGREDYTWKRGRKFESCRPHSVQKMLWLVTLMESLQINFFYFLILKMVFWKKFAECFLALGKHFAMCPIKDTRQRPSLPMFVRRVQHTAKTLPCVFLPLPLPCAKAHGNQPASRSEGNNDGMECNKSTCENNSPRKTMDEMGFWGIGKVKMMM